MFVNTFINSDKNKHYMIWEIIGYIAAFCTTFSFLPQIVKAVKTKELDDFSYIYLFVLCFGVFLWLVYGFAISNWVIVVANVPMLVFVVIIISLKKAYSKNKFS